MNKKLFSVILLITLFVFAPSIKADTQYVINDKCSSIKCSIRTEANENGTFLVSGMIHYLDPGDIVSLVDGTKVASTNDKCSTEYYYVTYAGRKGYVCGDYINFNTEGTYYDELRNAGFPESYLLSLNALKEKYPNWIFTPYKTGLDFEQVITNESNVEYDSKSNKYWSRSYIQSTNELYLSRQNGSYNMSDNTFNQMEAGGWYAANKQTVAFYMDPRNFLNIYDVFMFENLGYNSNYQTKGVLEKIFNGTDLLQYADHYIEAANYEGNNVSPIFLGARSRQEVVLSDGKLSDSANGLTGVYNFYNIGAYSSCENPIACGLQYATNRGWTDPRLAIIGGATEIAEGYINKKQDTLYFQRFNVTNNIYGNFGHQYMTNIEAPKSESRSTYTAYSKIENLLDSSIEFVIPVYENMPDTASLLPTTLEEVKVEIDLSKMISELGYIIKGDFVIVPMNKQYTELSNEMSTKDVSTSVKMVDENNNVLATGDVITFSSGDNKLDLTVVIKGDASGDGKVTAFDYLKIKNYIMETGTLDGAYKEAADVDNNNQVTAFDYLNIKNYIMGNNSVLNR